MSVPVEVKPSSTEITSLVIKSVIGAYSYRRSRCNHPLLDDGERLGLQYHSGFHQCVGHYASFHVDLLVEFWTPRMSEFHMAYSFSWT